MLATVIHKWNSTLLLPINMLFLKISRFKLIQPPQQQCNFICWKIFLALILSLLFKPPSHFFVQCSNNVEDQQIVSCPSKPVVIVLPVDNKTCASSRNWQSSSQLYHLLAEDNDGNPMEIPHCGEVSFSCWAPKPITWDYDGPLFSRSLKVKSIKVTRDVSDPLETSSFCYNAILTITMYRKFIGTGKYTCSILTDPQKSSAPSGIDITDSQEEIHFDNPDSKSSLYLFRNENQPVAFHTFKPRRGTILPNEIIVPCRVNNPNVSVELEKQDPSTRQFKRVNREEINATYDKYMGFRFKTAPGATKSFFGKYKCKVNDSGSSIVVDLKDNGIQKPPSISPELDIKFIDDISCWSITCSSKSPELNPTYLEFFECNNAIKCNMLLEVLLNNPSSISRTPYTPTDDSCGMLTSMEAGSISLSSEELRRSSAGMAVCATENGSYYQYLQFWSNFTSETHKSLFSASHPRGAVILQPGPNTPSDAVMSLSVSKKTLYVNETVVLRCTASNFLFSDGLKWLAMFSNGTLGKPHGMELSSTNESVNGRFRYQWSVNVTTDDVVSYICLAPLWNSSQWINKSYPVRVIDGKPPIIHQNMSSPVDQVFNDKEKKVAIRCEAWGIPQPEITWWRGDLEFLDETQNAHPHIDLYTKEDSNISISTLIFENVVNNGSSITGAYTCNATNPKGTVLYTIRVGTENHSTWKVWATIFGVCTVFFVSILIFYLYKFWRKSEAQEKYIHQLTTKDIDLFKFGRRDLLQGHATVADLENTVSSGRDLALILPYQNQYEVNEADVFIDEYSPKLGEGYFGVVIHAKYKTKTGQLIDVAVKTLKSWNTSQAKALLDELKILSYVGKHDHVVSLVGAITNIEESKIQVILEYCAEGSLDKYLVEKRNYFLDEISDDKICFSVNTAVTQSFASSYVRIDYAIKTFDLIRWAYQFACGMQYLASKKIIHGDLASRNLLLTDTRDVKISDFGLSKKIADTQDQYIPSGRMQQDQPWRSLAPEWFENKILSSATDVWAYGITLWEIFSLAELPYPRFPTYSPDFCDAIQRGHRNPQPQYANTYIYEILLSCWDADPSNRPTFTDLTKIFLDLLPKNYVKTIDVNVHQPRDYITAHLEYILHHPMEPLQMHEQC